MSNSRDISLDASSVEANSVIASDPSDTSTTANNNDLLEIGQLRSAYGLQGWLWIYSNTDPIANIFDYQPWLIEKNGQYVPIKVKAWRTQGKGIVALLDGVPDRTASEQLIGTKLFMSKALLPKASSGEYYWSDLIGLNVYGVTDDSASDPTFNTFLGQVSHLFETGANDVLVVKPSEGSVDTEEHLIPWHEETIHNIDLPNRRIEVNWGADY